MRRGASVKLKTLRRKGLLPEKNLSFNYEPHILIICNNNKMQLVVEDQNAFIQQEYDRQTNNR